MRIEFLLAPAGGGKTFRCLAEIRSALAASPEGPPLLLVAPKQTTYQLERQLLADPDISGYTRLHILSFERLARFVFEALGKPAPDILDEEGRLMVLRGLLAKKRDSLRLFRASARLTGFAQQLSLVLRELQRHQLTPERLEEIAAQARDAEGLAYKLQDLATLLREYLEWLKSHNLQDADCLLDAATAALLESAEHEASARARGALRFGRLWVDGFLEWSPQELELIAAAAPHCEATALTFCLDRVPAQKISWLSTWSVATRAFHDAQERLGSLPGADLGVEVLQRRPDSGRFQKSPALAHLEEFWAEPQPFSEPANPQANIREEGAPTLEDSVRAAACVNPEAEAVVAAREILRHVRAGGRYREAAVLVRNLAGYHEILQRTFARYEIPFFLDRRESVSHHPLAELTRSALRTVVFDWRHDDWFAALKTGLVAVDETQIDRLENEALARGWSGKVWQEPIVIRDDPEQTKSLADLQARLMPPFQRLRTALAARQNRPTGPELAGALRDLWRDLNVEQRLDEWGAAEVSSSEFRVPGSIHSTVWEQMNAWLANVELAFPDEALRLREWLPILEAGLSNLTVGLIPPALDQVLIGALDRSRNPDIKLALVLGWNEGVFPAPSDAAVILTDADREELEGRQVRLGASARQHLGREGQLAYIACTRPRERLVLTWSLNDSEGAPLNPSPFVARVQQLFPSLEIEAVPRTPDWRESEHASELVAPLLMTASAGERDSGIRRLETVPALAAVLDRLRHFRNPDTDDALAPGLAARLYGPILRTSVSRMEQFAACPFKFLVHSGMKAEERKKFELDVKEQGSFQHDALAQFHVELRGENKRWRDITPVEARERIARIAGDLASEYREGLFQSTEQSRFAARVLTESLEDFVETLVGWMRGQYLFDPVAVEMPFGEDEEAPAWRISLGDDRSLEVYGRIDRVDLFKASGGGDALCVVVDYKSSQRQLDPLLMAHGIQLQLPTYLSVLRQWPNPRLAFGAERLIPAGVFYVNLRGHYEREANRRNALADPAQARKRAYRHTGRFDVRALPQLDGGDGDGRSEQFNFRRLKSGEVDKRSREAMDAADFAALLDSVEINLRRMGREVFSGVAQVAPYRKGAMTACEQCSYAAVCRIDPWTHRFRVLRKEEEK